MTAPGRPGSALVIGEALVDVVIHPGQEPVDIPGGAPANVALGLARLGRDAELHCWIGTDERGQAVRSHLEASGVRLAPGADGATRTSTAQATIGEDRAASYVFDLDWNPPRPTLPDGQAPLLVHTGSIAAILAPGAAVAYMTADFSSSGSYSMSGLHDEKVDAAISKAAAAEPGDERRKAIMAAEQAILVTGAAIPLAHERVIQGEAAGVSGAQRDPGERALITSATTVKK